jgi:hypothetical protein
MKQIEEESQYYNMKLNRGTCINLTMNQQSSSIKFSDGTLMKREATAEYLGTILSDSANNGIDINNRISKATGTANKSGIFGNKANTSIKWKLRAFEAIIKSQLLYGLETTQLNQPEQRQLYAFQMKGLRMIMRIHGQAQIGHAHTRWYSKS